MIFPPLFASVAWWRLYVGALLQGSAVAACMEAASSDIRRRDRMRFAVSGGAVLSLPVVGGASALKNRAPETWRLAPEAARESRKMLHTLETLYGRSPYFHLLADEVVGSVDNYLPGMSAEEVCQGAFKRVCAVLGLDDDNLLASLSVHGAEPRFRQIRAALYVGVSPELSILDPLFRLVPSTLLIL